MANPTYSPTIGPPAQETPHNPAAVVVEDTEDTELSSRADASRLARRYAKEIGTEFADPRLAPDSDRRTRVALWAIGLSIVSLMTAVLALIAFQPPALQVDVSAGQAAPIVDIKGGDACVIRQQELMRSIIEYKKQFGKLPQSLAELQPPILTVPPVDPLSNAPYQYGVVDGQVRLSCPNPQEHSDGKPASAVN